MTVSAQPEGEEAFTICNLPLSPHLPERLGCRLDKPATPFHRRRAERGCTSGDICTASSCWSAFVSLKPFPSSLPLGPCAAAPFLSLSVSLCPTLYACVCVRACECVCVNVSVSASVNV